MSDIIMVIAPANFRDEELFETRKALEQGGFSTALASVRSGVCTGSKGGQAIAEIDLGSADLDEYEAIVFVGGNGCSVFFEKKEALNAARIMQKAGKIVGAICLAPIILARAGILKNRKATVTPSEIGLLGELGSEYSGPGVITDGNIVTADGPSSSRLFGQTIARLLKMKEDS